MDLEAESAITVDTAVSSDIATSCNKLLETQKQIAKIDEQLKKFKDTETTLSEQTIPNLMQQAGVSLIKLKDGSSVEIKPFYAARIPSSKIEEAFEWLRDNLEQKKYLGVILNNDCWLDVDTGNANKNYVPINKNEKKDYVNNILSRKKLPYENEPIPITSEILGMIPKAYENFEKIRRKIGWISNATIILKTTNGDDDLIIAISCNGNGFTKISNDDIKKYKVRMILSLDIRLLKWLLYGPDKAHWSDADLGSHLRYERVGSIYKRGLFYCWNNFCAVT